MIPPVHRGRSVCVVYRPIPDSGGTKASSSASPPRSILLPSRELHCQCRCVFESVAHSSECGESRAWHSRHAVWSTLSRCLRVRFVCPSTSEPGGVGLVTPLTPILSDSRPSAFLTGSQIHEHGR